MRITDLRALLGTALLACGASPKQPPDNHGAGSDTTTTASKCQHEPPNVTGCGGAEVKVTDFKACGIPQTDMAELPATQCKELCGNFEARSCHVYGNDGSWQVFCDAANPCMGRMASDGLLARSEYADATIQRLALARRMEARSVDAFVELAADLARWGAPQELVDACAKAADDEARHADAMAALLRARGIEPEVIAPIRAPGFASLRELALHNEREGVAGETWGALLALHEAEHAIDDDVRAAMRVIAEEETEHAHLSLAIAAWVRTQVPAAELDAVRRDAFARFAHPAANILAAGLA